MRCEDLVPFWTRRAPSPNNANPSKCGSQIWLGVRRRLRLNEFVWYLLKQRNWIAHGHFNKHRSEHRGLFEPRNGLV